MLSRVTNKLMIQDLAGHLRQQGRKIHQLQNQISSQKKLLKMKQDPRAAELALQYKSRIQDTQGYTKTIQNVQGRFNFIQSKFQEVNTYLQEIREKSIRGLNGVLSKEGRQALGIEVEELLKQMVLAVNSRWKGETLFGGFQVDTKAYEADVGLNGGLIGTVTYRGDLGQKYREVSRGEYIATDEIGPNVFWSTHEKLRSQTSATGYTALSLDKDKPYQDIRINGHRIRIDNYDNLQTIVDKINSSGALVRAEIDNTTGQDLLVLQTTRPTKLWLSDESGGRILQELGLITGDRIGATSNIEAGVHIEGKSLFENLIDLRNGLLKSDINQIHRELGALDLGMENVRQALVRIGAKQTRLETLEERLSQNLVYTQELYSKVQNVNLAEAINNLKTQELAHQATLQIGARIIRPSLLDYLR